VTLEIFAVIHVAPRGPRRYIFLSKESCIWVRFSAIFRTRKKKENVVTEQ